jgi:hypothetical protein
MLPRMFRSWPSSGALVCVVACSAALSLGCQDCQKVVTDSRDLAGTSQAALGDTVILQGAPSGGDIFSGGVRLTWGPSFYWTKLAVRRLEAGKEGTFDAAEVEAVFCHCGPTKVPGAGCLPEVCNGVNGTIDVRKNADDCDQGVCARTLDIHFEVELEHDELSFSANAEFRLEQHLEPVDCGRPHNPISRLERLRLVDPGAHAWLASHDETICRNGDDVSTRVLPSQTPTLL